ncbi:Ig-like domain-containing protein [Catenovulum sediminis]|uniref:Ig-like domain-containing protein n=1 Tax=Catenovulum sediminis TaxID=1740262 RepID=UPI001FE84549|nr:Ig-like domain-containing protein [Catenovulum sediminis]
MASTFKQFNDTALIGGYTTAFPIFEERDFARWNERMKLFIDTSGEYMDFFSIHIYDFNNLGNDGKVNFKGGRFEATFDMMEHYSNIRLGEVKPFVLSEYAGRDHKLEKNYWSSYRDWQSMKAISPLLLTQMARPNQILKSIPFINVKAIWGTSEGIPYNWRLLRQENESEAGLSGDWVFTDVVKFYELWSDVSGTRVDSKTTNPDVLIDTYVDGNTAYVILSNLEYEQETVYLNLFGHQQNDIQSVKIKHLHLDGANVALDIIEQNEAPEAFTLDTEATAIIEYTFNNELVIDHTAKEGKYYASTYNQAISANQSTNFTISNVSLSEYGDAVLRLGIGRALDKSRIPQVTFNGVNIDVPTNFSGDEQENRPEFFSLLEIPVPYDLLQEENTVSVTFPDAGGRISSVSMQVFEHSTDFRTKSSPVTGVALSHDQHVLAVGETITLEGKALPFYAQNTAVTFSVDNTEVASITETGELTGLSAGTVVVNATSVEGGFIAESTITVEAPVAASLQLDNPSQYANTTYYTDGTLDITSLYNAGTGETVSDQFSGVSYLLRQLNANWDVVKDYSAVDYGAIGKQRGISTVSMPLENVTPTAQLPDGHFYFLFVRFASTDGTVKSTTFKGINIEESIVEENVEPSMSFDDANQYTSQTYISGDTLPVSVNYQAGTGNTVTDTLGGVKFFLRLIDKSSGSWQVVSDIIANDNSVVSMQSGIATANLSLTGVLPTASLPADHFYYLWVRFESSNGLKYSVNAFPITIEAVNIEPSLSFDDLAQYTATTYLTSGSLDVNLNVEAGSGNVVTDGLGGVKVFLRHLRSNWSVVNDTIVYDASVVGEQTANASVSIPLAGLTPSAQLPEGDFYFLFVQFESSNGNKYSVAANPITIDSDFDQDGIGDSADNDDDNDGVPDSIDHFQYDDVYGVLGDFDGDNDVDRKDISYFVRALRDPSRHRPDFDFNGDGRVHQSDVSRLRTLCTRRNCAE